MITEVDKKIVAALNKGEEYWTFKEDARSDRHARRREVEARVKTDR